MTTAGLTGYTSEVFAAGGLQHTVFRRGHGPAVIVLAEIPGITPRVLEFADRVADLECTVWLPQLYGSPGRPPSTVYLAQSATRACVAREFAAFATDRTAPFSDWLRALGAHAHQECGGPGIGAVGMCFTGGFALGMALDERMLAPVLSQPSLPLALPVPASRRRAAASVHLAATDAETLARRAAAGQCVMGLRFTGDPLVPAERFEALRSLLGPSFIGVEIDSSPGNPWGIRQGAHSVLTEDLSADDPEHPTAVALDRVLGFLRDRLLTA